MEDRKAQDGSHVEVQDGSRLEEIGTFNKRTIKMTPWIIGEPSLSGYIYITALCPWLRELGGCGAGKIVRVRTPGSLL